MYIRGSPVTAQGEPHPSAAQHSKSPSPPGIQSVIFNPSLYLSFSSLFPSLPSSTVRSTQTSLLCTLPVVIDDGHRELVFPKGQGWLCAYGLACVLRGSGRLKKRFYMMLNAVHEVCTVTVNIVLNIGESYACRKMVAPCKCFMLQVLFFIS